jgi:hypothetical protein
MARGATADVPAAIGVAIGRVLRRVSLALLLLVAAGFAGGRVATSQAAGSRPSLGRTVLVTPVAGTVLFTEHGEKPVVLSGSRLIALGATLNAADGAVQVLAAAGAGEATELTTFSAGRFVLTQSRSGLLDARLVGGRAAPEVCGARTSRLRAEAAARRREVDRVRARTSPPGHVRLTGEYASAGDPGGAEWTVVDYCGSTLTTVSRGQVSVMDFVRQRTVIVFSGQSYLAAPVADTGEASAITQTTATLNASVNPNGSEVTGCAFEYGLTPSFGETALCSPPPGSGLSPTTVSALVSGLPANTTVHFRTIATNARGTSDGAETVFTTLPYPPLAEIDSASSITATTATLTATVDFNGAPDLRCEFEYGPTTAYESRAPCAPASGAEGGEEASLVGLPPASTIYYRIVAANQGGTSEGEGFFNTLSPPPTVEVPEATESGEGWVTLAGTVNPNGMEVTSCEFEYGPSPQLGDIIPCPQDPGSGNAPVVVTTIIEPPGTATYYRIVATSAVGFGESPELGTQDAVWTGTATVAPGEPQKARLSAKILGSLYPFQRCEFQYGETEEYGESVPCGSLPSGQSEEVYAQTGPLAPGRTYQFRVVASTSVGIIESEDRTFDTAPPQELSLAPPQGPQFPGSYHQTAVITEEGVPASAGTPVTFEVSGANPRPASVEHVEGSAGEASFSYEGRNPGKDRISARFVNARGEERSGEVTLTWTFGSGFVLPLEGRAARPVLMEEAVAPRSGVLASDEFSIGFRLVAVQALSGSVSVKLPSGRHLTLPELPQIRPKLIPIGSTIDADHGDVELTAPVLGGQESGEFSGGTFEVSRGRSRRDPVELILIEPPGARVRCARTGGARTVLARLGADSHGDFVLRGRYSEANAPDSVFSVLDRCGGTSTTLTRGRGTVRELVRHRTVALTSGQSYLASAP